MAESRTTFPSEIELRAAYEVISSAHIAGWDLCWELGVNRPILEHVICSPKIVEKANDFAAQFDALERFRTSDAYRAVMDMEAEFAVYADEAVDYIGFVNNIIYEYLKRCIDDRSQVSNVAPLLADVLGKVSFASIAGKLRLAFIAALKALPTGDDRTAYRPFKEFLDNDFPDYNSIHKALRENPWIRTDRTVKQRPKIHAGDWFKMRNQTPADPTDIPAEVADALLETERRKTQERRRKPVD